MARKNVRIEVPAKYVLWEARMEAAAGEVITPGAVREWEVANDRFFDRTQRYAHVLSGDMLEGGRTETIQTGIDEVTSYTTYGGNQRSVPPHWKHQKVEYVKYELRRGGSHDFITRAVHSSKDDFLEGVGKSLVKLMKERFG